MDFSFLLFYQFMQIELFKTRGVYFGFLDFGFCPCCPLCKYFCFLLFIVSLSYCCSTHSYEFSLFISRQKRLNNQQFTPSLKYSVFVFGLCLLFVSFIGRKIFNFSFFSSSEKEVQLSVAYSTPHILHNLLL